MLPVSNRHELSARPILDFPWNALNLCRIVAVVMIAFVTSVATAAQPEWLRSLEEGQKAAQASEKNVLIVFTGHGWCAHCEVLDREVFQQAEFVEATRGQFIFVELDFNFGESDEEQLRKAQYETLAERYLIKGYPTVVVADQQLRPFAYVNGYADGYGAQHYLDRIMTACQDYELFVQSSRTLESITDADAYEQYAMALARTASHLTVDEDRDDPFLKFYADNIDLILSELPEANENGRRFALRRQNQKFRSERKATWEPIAIRMNTFHTEQAWSQGIEYIQRTLPTLSDPHLQLRLGINEMHMLDRAERYEEALTASRALQERSDLDHQQRRSIANRESRFLLSMGQVDEAIARFDERIATAKQTGDEAQMSRLLGSKVQLMLSTDRLVETIAVCRASRQAAAPDSEEWLTATFLLALKLRQAGEFEEAFQLSTEQFKTQPQGMAMLDIAESLIGLDRPADARQWIERAKKNADELAESVRKGDRDFAASIASRVALTRTKLSAKN